MIASDAYHYGGNLPRRYNGWLILVKENAIPRLACLDGLFTGPPLELQRDRTVLWEADAAIRPFQGQAVCPSAGRGTHKLLPGCAALTLPQIRGHGVFIPNRLPPAAFDWPCSTAYNELYLAASVRPMHGKPASTLASDTMR